MYSSWDHTILYPQILVRLAPDLHLMDLLFQHIHGSASHISNLKGDLRYLDHRERAHAWLFADILEEWHSHAADSEVIAVFRAIHILSSCSRRGFAVALHFVAVGCLFFVMVEFREDTASHSTSAAMDLVDPESDLDPLHCNPSWDLGLETGSTADDLLDTGKPLVLHIPNHCDSFHEKSLDIASLARRSSSSCFRLFLFPRAKTHPISTRSHAAFRRPFSPIYLPDIDRNL